MAPTPVKEPDPPGTLQAVAAGLSVAPERGISWLDRFGPAISLFLVVALKVLLALEVLPNPGPVEDVVDFLLVGGALATGGWAGRLGAAR